MPAANFFSPDFTAARSKFLSAAQEAGAQCTHHKNPNALGPEGEELFLDFARLGPRGARRVLLNICGTHGAEGYAGSAGQTAWLTRTGASPLPRDLAVVFIHAANPFGFAWGLRATEQNIDLNRHWTDFAQALPANELYGALHSFLCPRKLDSASFAAASARITALAKEHGVWEVDDALSRGQYQHPDGFYWGGASPCWSREVITGIANAELKAARHLAVIDWHSGPIGDGELIHLCYSMAGTETFARTQDLWGGNNLASNGVNRLWGGVQPTRYGVLFDGLADLLSGAELAGGVIEICSAQAPDGPAGALRVSMLERWLRFEAGLNSPKAKKICEEIRHHYAPDRRRFQEAAIENACLAIDDTIAGLARQGLEKASA